MDEELAIIQREKEKIANRNRSKDVAILQQTLEPVEEKLEGVSSAIGDLIKLVKNTPKDVEYFDKDFNSKLITSLTSALSAIKNIKFPEQKPIDLSPINSIAAEIKKQNESIIQLLNKPNQSEEIVKQVIAMIGKQNSFLEREIKQVDNTKELTAISKSIEDSKSPKQWEFEIIRRQGGSIDKVIAKSK